MKTALNPDETMREVVLAVIAKKNPILASLVRVGVSNAIVHLAGKVDSLALRDVIENLVKQVPGVRGVVNRIECPGGPSPARTVNLDIKN